MEYGRRRGVPRSVVRWGDAATPAYPSAARRLGLANAVRCVVRYDVRDSEIVPS
jgi:hypothetical protein